jgi:hypothetical protein
MPKSDISRLNHRAPIDRAQVNIAPSNPDAMLRATADDGRVYLPLIDPTGSTHGYSPPGALSAPSEVALREQLATALEEQREAEERLAAAQDAHIRALRHVEACQVAADAYARLDEVVAAAIVAQLIDTERACIALDATLHEKIAARSLALVTLQAARAADEMLTRNLAAARGVRVEAETAVDRLVTAILGFSAETIADRHAVLVAEATRLRELLLGYDHYGANRGIRLPPKVRMAMGSDMQAFARQHDQTRWKSAAAALRSRLCCGDHIKWPISLAHTRLLIPAPTAFGMNLGAEPSTRA